LRETWTPGEEGAQERLEDFVSTRVCGYASMRDLPGVESTSRLSPHLANGEITPAQIIHALAKSDADASIKDRTVFRKEVGWREFSYHLLVNEPELPRENFNVKFDGFPWKDDEAALLAWKKGNTGYPIVDAGMRELWQTGWMHNRVRMVTASFLTKHLMIDWREGERWFWDTLVDADPASNAASWQWVAGSGADAAPYFRIFNPIIQGEKFDPDGDYVRRYVPELANLPSKFIHKPWAAPEDVLAEAGVHLGETYPMPIVDHQQARNRALAAYEKIKDAA
jgi:deoxyribodipyrimidine photo-lyase